MIIRVKSLKTISMHKPHHLISIFSITISKPLTEPHFFLLPYSYKSTFWWSWLTRYSLTSNGIWIRTAFAVIIHFQVSAIKWANKLANSFMIWMGYPLFSTCINPMNLIMALPKSTLEVKVKVGHSTFVKKPKNSNFPIKNHLLFSKKSRPFSSF